MKIVFLGTNGWYSTPTGDTTCVLLETNERYIILDAGNGFYKLDRYITEKKPVSLFISHFHLDHTSGLHILNKFNFPGGLDVYVGEGRAIDFETLVNPPFTIGYMPQRENIVDLKMEVRLREYPEAAKDMPFKAISFEQHHAYGNHGFRFEIEDRIIAYTGDCGFTEKSKELAKNADLLITECSNKTTRQPDNWGHLDPLQAATLAKDSGAKQLLLTHFGASIYPTLTDREWAEEEARRIFSKTIAANDGLEFLI